MSAALRTSEKNSGKLNFDMCGRFAQRFTWEELLALLELCNFKEDLPDDFWENLEKRREGQEARYNIAPTQRATVIRSGAEKLAEPVAMRWGLIPPWARDESIGLKCINARSEEASSKPAFRGAVRQRRCLVPLSSFYEWQAVEGQKQKQPWSIGVRDVPVFAVAGLWERWEGGPEPVETFAVMTRAANEFMSPLHERMPVIVEPKHYLLWLDSEMSEVEKLEAVMAPFPASRMRAHRVSTRVNNVRNDDETLLEEVAGREEPGTLFG